MSFAHFLLYFRKLNLAIFWAYLFVNGQGIPCGRNSYSFIPILRNITGVLDMV